MTCTIVKSVKKIKGFLYIRSSYFAIMPKCRAKNNFGD